MLWLALLVAIAAAQECANQDAVYIAGYEGDGYFTRAKHTLISKLNLEPEIVLLKSKHEFEDWLVDFENKHDRALHHRFSTLVWLENPLLIWGDSDLLEAYLEINEPRPSLREFGTAREVEQAEGWKRNPVQAVVCSNNIRLGCEDAPSTQQQFTFHIILEREWNPMAFDQFTEAGFAPFELKDMQVNRRYGWIKFVLLDLPKGSHRASKRLVGASEDRRTHLGSLLTNGTHVRIVDNEQVDATQLDGFFAIGYVPVGDLEKRRKEEWADSYDCRYLPNGVAYVLAMDRLAAAGNTGF